LPGRLRFASGYSVGPGHRLPVAPRAGEVYPMGASCLWARTRRRLLGEPRYASIASSVGPSPPISRSRDSTTLKLTLNRKTVSAVRLTISKALLLRADEVIQ
jgi:hypothetical protein